MTSVPPSTLPSLWSAMNAATALSTRLSIEVMITAWRAGSSTVLYWSESTPIARP